MIVTMADPERSLERRQLTAELAARELLSRSIHFNGRAHRFEFQQEGDVLVVDGVVPTFYLKQMLQCLLMNLEEVRRIVNRVKVINCDGLGGTSVS